MKIEELLELIKEGETQQVEFKRNAESVGKSICSFLNTNDGIVIVGVDDDGKILGVSKREEERIMNYIREIQPRTFKVKIENLKIDHKQIIIIKVKKSNLLHTFRNIAYVRFGTTDRPLTLEEIYERATESVILRFDSLPNRLATKKDIKKELVIRYLEERKKVRGVDYRWNSRIFQQLNIIIDNQITNAGILFFGNPTKYFPYVKTRIIIFSDNTKSKILDEKEFDGSVWLQFKDSIKYLISILRRFKIIKGIKREEMLEIPIEILREGIANAIIHRNYLDTREIMIFIFPSKIQIINPGSFPPGVDPENPIHKPRNPLLAQYFYDIGIVDKYGSGIMRMKHLAQENNINIKYKLKANTTFLTISRPLMPLQDLDEISIKILNLLNTPKKSSELAKSLNVSEDTVLRRLKVLIEKGFVKRIGRGKATTYLANLVR